jgi:integrase
MSGDNHPPKGARIKVEPIRYLADIKRIKNLLINRPRDLALFTLGINTPLRVSDLLRLTRSQVARLAPGDPLVINEKRTGRRLKLGFNRVCCEAVADLLAAPAYGETGRSTGTDYLFPSRRGDVLLPSSVHRLVKSWCKAIALEGNYGANSLRKTWGYHQFATFGTDLSRLSTYFNHATRRQTLDYLCLVPGDFKSIFEHEL